MKIAIMQPYFLPYVGYFQLINAVDKFVVYDNIQFTKKGWINRNRILVNGKDEYFTLPLKKDSDYLNVDQRKLAETFPAERLKLLRKIHASYHKAPYFKIIFPLIEFILNRQDEDLFSFIFHSLKSVCNHLEIKTEFIISSTVAIDHSLKSEDKVVAICNALNADRYINPVGGQELYSKENFRQKNIELNFIKPAPVSYKQFNNEFIPWLSVIDVMMFNSTETLRQYIQSDYSII